MGGNASEGATAANIPAVPASKAASQLFISDMGPPAHKTASLAKILKSGALTKIRKAPAAHLQQPPPSLGDSRAGVQSAEAGPSAAVSDAAAAQAGQQHAASSSARQVICDTPPSCHACRLRACPASYSVLCMGQRACNAGVPIAEISALLPCRKEHVCLHVVTTHADLACISMLFAGRHVLGRHTLCRESATSLHGISVNDSQYCSRMGPPYEGGCLMSA